MPTAVVDMNSHSGLIKVIKFCSPILTYIQSQAIDESWLILKRLTLKQN